MDINRLFSELGQIGCISEVSEKGDAYKVCFDGVDGKYPSGWLRALTSRAGKDVESWVYDIGEQVLVLALAPNLESGVILGALYQAAHGPVSANPDEHKTVYGDGTEVIYNRESHVLKLIAVGSVDINTEGNARVSAGGDVKIDAGGSVKLNDGSGVVTGECVCHFTGGPHGDVSAVVFAGKA